MPFHKDMVGEDLHIGRSQVSTGNPNGVVTAGIIGEFYWDSTADILYVAEALDDSSWVDSNASTAGDVTGPASSVSGALAFFDDATGKLLDDIPGITTDEVDLRFDDNIAAIFGDGADFSISANAFQTTLLTDSGDLRIRNSDATGNIIFHLGSDGPATNVEFRNASDDAFLIIELQSDGDLVFEGLQGDLDIGTGGGGIFTFGDNSISAGISIAEALEIGHEATFSFINSIGTGEIRVQHDGVTQYIIKDSFEIEFAVAGILATVTGDLTFQPGIGEFLMTTDGEFRAGPTTIEYLSLGHDESNAFIDVVGDGLLQFQHEGVSIVTLSDAGELDFIAGDTFLDPDSVTTDLVTLESIGFIDGSTQKAAAQPDLASARLNTATFNKFLDTSSDDTTPNQVFLRADGLKMYIAGNNNNRIYEYDLTTAWDISTASLLQSLLVSDQDPDVRGVFFKPDGLRMYMAGANADSIYQYDLSTAWNISTAVFTAGQLISVITNTPNPISLQFKPDGLSFYVTSFNDKVVSRYDMTTAWDVTTASFDSEFTPSEPSDIIAGTFRSDGVILHVTSGGDDTIYEYLCTTPWDLSTTEFQSQLDVNGLGATAPRGVFVSPYNHKFFMSDNGADGIYEFDFGLDIGGIVTSRGPSPVVIQITTSAQLDALSLTSVITISVDTTLHIIGDVTTAKRFSIDTGITLHIEGDNNSTAKLTYTGLNATTFISGEGAIRIFSMKNVDATASENPQLFDLTGGGTINIRDVLNLTHWNLGNSNGQFFGIDSVFVDLSSGIELTNPTLVNVTDFAIEGTVFGGDFFNIETNDPASIINFTDVSGLSLSISGALFNISSKSNNNARFSVRNCKTTKDEVGDPVGHIFEPQTTGIETISAVADGSPANGTITAQAANGFGGTRHSCTTTYFDDEEVTITGTTSYNGTFQIFNVVAGVSFDTITSFVADDATGTVATARLDLTVSTNLTFAGDAMKIEGTNFYNGFVTALDVPDATSITVNGVFVGTSTGTYRDGGGIDQSDPRVIGNGNSPFVDSHYIATAFVNDNTTANGTIVNGTFTDMVFGTAADALIAGTTMERWRLVNELNGTFEYIGNEPFAGDITFDFTVESSGGAQDFRFNWQIDTGSGFADLPDAVEALVNVGTAARSVSKTFPLAASKGDLIKPQITRDAGTSAITATYATIHASQ